MNNKFNQQGIEKYSASGIFLENLVLILWIVFGFIACNFFSIIIAWIYFGFACLMIIFVLRKLLCTKCFYYDKWCHVGWGKLTALFFKKGDPAKFNVGIGQILAPATYGILILLPLILIIVSIIQDFSVIKLLILIGLIISAFLSSVTCRKKSCLKCKMRGNCKGCAIKN